MLRTPCLSIVSEEAMILLFLSFEVRFLKTRSLIVGLLFEVKAGLLLRYDFSYSFGNPAIP